jgi:hypothetical protein
LLLLRPAPSPPRSPHGGINRTTTAGGRSPIRVPPCARGSTIPRAGDAQGPVRSPRARGSTGPGDRSLPHALAFSAGAEINRSTSIPTATITSVLCTRGGSTEGSGTALWGVDASSASAGINRTRAFCTAVRSSVPHTRGHQPRGSHSDRLAEKRPPHARRSTEHVVLFLGRHLAFSARAGMSR